mgnify:CR=1 FL=1|jgi:hypothetical protein
MSSQGKIDLIRLSEDTVSDTTKDLLDKIQTNIANAYNATISKGVTISADTPKTSANLAGAIHSINVCKIVYDPTNRRLTITTTQEGVGDE